jgi:hypothetical protein
MEHLALYFFLLLFGALIVKFVYMFLDIFGDDKPTKKAAFVIAVAGEGPADTAKRWLIYNKKAIVGNRILNDVKIPENEKSDIDRGIDEAQRVLNSGGPCEITTSSKNSYYIHVINEILLVLIKLVNREIDGTNSKFFYEKDGEYKSTVYVQ